MSLSLCFCFFFFKQKTAYELRISDWSSDVCSSDLPSDERRLRWVVARRARYPRRTSQLSLPRDADIRRELARNLIAQAQAKLDARQAMADAAFGHVLKGDLGFGDRLKDQPLGDPLVIASLDPRRAVDRKRVVQGKRVSVR